MASITIRHLEESTKALLRIRAAHNGRSMEEEAREILRSTLTHPEPRQAHPVASIRRRMKAIGGVELSIPMREPLRELPELGK